MPDNQDAIDLKTGLFGLRVVGRDALVIFLFLAVMADSGLTYWEHLIRSQEHAEIMCALRINLYFGIQRQESRAINLYDLPTELWKCVPKFLVAK